MNNKYLEKIAASIEKHKDSKVKMGAQVLTGAAIASGASQRILGYHTVYHGTTKANADSIRKNGFNPKFGGSDLGAGHAHPNESQRNSFKKQSTGKVHVTKSPLLSTYFSYFQASHKNVRPGFVKARVSDNMWKSFKVDPHIRGGNKNTAATSTHKIDSKFIAGGKGSKGPAAFLNKKHLKRYYSSGANVKRGLTGLGMLIGGGSLSAYGASNLKKSFSDR